MFDFGNVRKLIYFPRSYERRRDPFVVFAVERWGNDWKGNENMEELVQGRASFYPLTRCQPYTDELWEAVQNWVQRREQLEKDFESLMKKGKLS